MSVLQLYRGPRLELRYNKRQGSQSSVVLVVDQTVVMRATPSDLQALQRWFEYEARALFTWMREAEDITVAENIRGDMPEGG